MSDFLLTVDNLKMHFPITQGIIIQRKVGAIKAVDGVSLSIDEGETLGLVGESGCGKTTAGRTILSLIRATSGSVLFRSKKIGVTSGAAGAVVPISTISV